MRSFTHLAAIKRKNHDFDDSEIQDLILERLLNSQWCFSPIKKEVTVPGSNPLPLDCVALVLSNCAIKFKGP